MKKLLLALALLAAPAAAQDQPFVWQLRPEVGSKWTIRSFQRMRLTEIFPSIEYPKNSGKKSPPLKLEMRTNQTVAADWDVLSKDGAGNFTVKVTYRDLKSSNQTLLDGKPAPAREAKLVADFFSSTMADYRKVSLTIKLSPSAKVLAVQGADRLAKIFRDSFDSSSSPASQAMKPLFADILTQEGVQQLFSQNGELPKSSFDIGRGYSYTIKAKAPAAFAPEVIGTRILNKRDAGIATFGETGEVELDNPSLKFGAGFPGKMAMRLSGNLVGTTQVSEETGLTTESTLDTRMNGDLTISARPLPQPVQVPVWALVNIHVVLEPRQ